MRVCSTARFCNSNAQTENACLAATVAMATTIAETTLTNRHALASSARLISFAARTENACLAATVATPTTTAETTPTNKTVWRAITASTVVTESAFLKFTGATTRTIVETIETKRIAVRKHQTDLHIISTHIVRVGLSLGVILGIAIGASVLFFSL